MHGAPHCPSVGLWGINLVFCDADAWFLVMLMHATFVLKCGKCRLCMQQCNVMESCTMFMTFFPYFMILILIWLFRKTQIDCPFERGDNSCNLILSFANLSWNSLRVYVLFDLVTWPFWSDDNGAVWLLINPLKSQGLSPFLCLKTSTGEYFWSAPRFACGSCTVPLIASV